MFSKRLFSWSDTFNVFVACTIPVFFWATLSYLDALPALLLRLNIWDMVGVTSYVLAFALFESLIYLLPLVLVALFLPSRFKSHFVALGSLAAIITGIWLMFINFRGYYYGAVTLEQFLLGLGLYLVSILVPSFLALRFQRFEQAIVSLIDRFTVLAFVYLSLACIGALIVLFRNI